MDAKMDADVLHRLMTQNPFDSLTVTCEENGTYLLHVDRVLAVEALMNSLSPQAQACCSLSVLFRFHVQLPPLEENNLPSKPSNPKTPSDMVTVSR
jgi:hypothetical protein